jgi:hypothetical protein
MRVKSIWPVGHVAREVVAGLARFRVLEPEDLVVEVARAEHVVDLEGDVDDPVHADVPICGKGFHYLRTEAAYGLDRVAARGNGRGKTRAA